MLKLPKNQPSPPNSFVLLISISLLPNKNIPIHLPKKSRILTALAFIFVNPNRPVSSNGPHVTSPDRILAHSNAKPPDTFQHLESHHPKPCGRDVY